MKALLTKILLAIWSVACFAAGVFFALKTSKPQTVVNNSIRKVKGQGNTVTNEPKTTIENTGKKKFRLFWRKNKRQSE